MLLEEKQIPYKVEKVQNLAPSMIYQRCTWLVGWLGGWLVGWLG